MDTIKRLRVPLIKLGVTRSSRIPSLTDHRFNWNIYHFVLTVLWRIQLLIKTYLCIFPNNLF